MSNKSKRLSEIYYIEEAERRKERAQTNYNNIDHHFDKDKYNQGTNWALERKNLEDAGELANNKSFLNGYARGLRLIKIEIDSQTPPIKR